MLSLSITCLFFFGMTYSFHIRTLSLYNCKPLRAGFGAAKEVAPKTLIPTSETPCICGSGLSYGDCCQPFHSGTAYPSDPVKMVRSRFSALAYRIIPYVMITTHPDHKDFVDEEQKSKRKTWEKELLIFSKEYDFLTLKFDQEEIDRNPSSDIATVSFTAKLRKTESSRPAEDIKEVSTFLKVNDKWLYAGASYYYK